MFPEGIETIPDISEHLINRLPNVAEDFTGRSKYLFDFLSL